MNAINGLSEDQRQQALLLLARLQALESEFQALLQQAKPQSEVVSLPTRGINETQAADLRARLNTFAEDWDRPEAAIYDQAPAR